MPDLLEKFIINEIPFQIGGRKRTPSRMRPSEVIDDDEESNSEGEENEILAPEDAEEAREDAFRVNSFLISTRQVHFFENPFFMVTVCNVVQLE